MNLKVKTTFITIGVISFIVLLITLYVKFKENFLLCLSLLGLILLTGGVTWIIWLITYSIIKGRYDRKKEKAKRGATYILRDNDLEDLEKYIREIENEDLDKILHSDMKDSDHQRHVKALEKRKRSIINFIKMNIQV